MAWAAFLFGAFWAFGMGFLVGRIDRNDTNGKIDNQ